MYKWMSERECYSKLTVGEVYRKIVYTKHNTPILTESSHNGMPICTVCSTDGKRPMAISEDYTNRLVPITVGYSYIEVWLGGRYYESSNETIVNIFEVKEIKDGYSRDYIISLEVVYSDSSKCLDKSADVEMILKDFVIPDKFKYAVRYSIFKDHYRVGGIEPWFSKMKMGTLPVGCYIGSADPYRSVFKKDADILFKNKIIGKGFKSIKQIQDKLLEVTGMGLTELISNDLEEWQYKNNKLIVDKVIMVSPLEENPRIFLYNNIEIVLSDNNSFICKQDLGFYIDFWMEHYGFIYITINDRREKG